MIFLFGFTYSLSTATDAEVLDDGNPRDMAPSRACQEQNKRKDRASFWAFFITPYQSLLLSLLHHTVSNQVTHEASSSHRLSNVLNIPSSHWHLEYVGHLFFCCACLGWGRRAPSRLFMRKTSDAVARRLSAPLDSHKNGLWESLGVGQHMCF